MIDEDKRLYHDALGKWGKHTQILMAIEEMSELTFWLCKMIREEPEIGNPRDIEILTGITEEMADVEVMMGQLKYMFSNEPYVETIREYKKRGMRERIIVE